jgi:glutathione S-transferase
MRARMALLAAGIRCEVREVALAQKPQSMLDLSPKGTVPVLVLPDAVIEQSLDIMLWALRQHDPHSWLPQDSQVLSEQLALIAACDDGFKHHLDRYKYPGRYNLPDGVSNRDAGAEFLQQLNQRLTQSSYLSGDGFGLADAAIAPFVRQFAHTDPDWFAAQDWGRVQQWLLAFESSAPYQQCMHKYKVWYPGHKPLTFPPA